MMDVITLLRTLNIGETIPDRRARAYRQRGSRRLAESREVGVEGEDRLGIDVGSSERGGSDVALRGSSQQIHARRKQFLEPGGGVFEGSSLLRLISKHYSYRHFTGLRRDDF